MPLRSHKQLWISDIRASYEREKTECESRTNRPILKVISKSFFGKMCDEMVSPVFLHIVSLSTLSCRHECEYYKTWSFYEIAVRKWNRLTSEIITSLRLFHVSSADSRDVCASIYLNDVTKFFAFNTKLAVMKMLASKDFTAAEKVT